MRSNSGNHGSLFVCGGVHGTYVMCACVYIGCVEATE